ncbi:hypothetical protein J5N97_014434 [Dioscorea zingiberensis]|uniref:Uncharacterized protein n=1 Tax=Dioscorea zingiberensis TaxID=325984 RepID=A0A9D5HJH7_9LILI|nr:hypothetical protein J5N97_014434 [Dioscorea zingiberensis]
MKVISFPTLFASIENKLSNKTKKKKNPKSPRSISRADATSSSSWTSFSSEDSVSSIHRSSTAKTVLPESPSSDLFDRDKITMSDLETVLCRLGHSSVSNEELSLMLTESRPGSPGGGVTLDALSQALRPGDLATRSRLRHGWRRSGSPPRSFSAYSRLSVATLHPRPLPEYDRRRQTATGGGFVCFPRLCS